MWGPFDNLQPESWREKPPDPDGRATCQEEKPVAANPTRKRRANIARPQKSHLSNPVAPPLPLPFLFVVAPDVPASVLVKVGLVTPFPAAVMVMPD